MGPDCLRQTPSGRCHLPAGHDIECIGIDTGPTPAQALAAAEARGRQQGWTEAVEALREYYAKNPASGAAKWSADYLDSIAKEGSRDDPPRV